MNMKYTTKPAYESVEIIGKTFNTVTGSIDRKLVGRVLITEEAGFDGAHVLVDGDTETVIKSVVKTDEVEVFAELVGGVKSLASVKFFGAYARANSENADVLDVFTTEHDKVERVVAMALRMSEAHPECDGQWKIVTADGKRVFLREYAAVNAYGKIDG